MAPPDGRFDAMDSWPWPRLRRWWERRLRRTLAVAGGLPFYRERFRAAGFDPSSFRKLEDLTAVPVMRREDVLGALRGGGHYLIGMERVDGEAVLAMSSGTEGATSFVALPRRWRPMERRASVRAHWWAGVRPGDTFLLSAPAWHIYALGQVLLIEALRLRAVVTWGTYLPHFAPRILHAIVTFRPRFLALFLPMAFSLLEEARRQGMRAERAFAGVEALMVAGAPITPGMRERLREEMGIGRVVEAAGSTEGFLATECGQGEGLHLVPEKSYAEVLDPETWQSAAPGERGALVITNTWPWGSLYLRYDTGDAAVAFPGPCPCGRPYPRVKLLGRRAYRFRLGGRDLLPYDVQHAVEEAVPAMRGATLAILREGLDRGELHLLAQGQGLDTAGIGPRLQSALSERFDVPVRIEWGRELPLRWKGVPPVLERAQVGEVR
ncbi:Phenylacetate-coenzyme A ligase [bacterium HR24]|jgi:phenylacetate-CoA ligase|nr:Phenylacetate-coenzyme A ligase [bacterium HR24]